MILERLKHDTRSDHEAVEALAHVMDAHLTLADYRDYLLRMHRVHAALEPQLAATPGLATALLDVDERWKADLARADLEALGAQPLSAPAVPAIDSVAHALGCLYVLEGSTLGARFVTRHVDATLGDAVHSARRYLVGYGERTGARWKSFGEAVERHCAGQPAREDAVVAGAKTTFAVVRNALRAS